MRTIQAERDKGPHVIALVRSHSYALGERKEEKLGKSKARPLARLLSWHCSARCRKLQAFLQTCPSVTTIHSTLGTGHVSNSPKLS